MHGTFTSAILRVLLLCCVFKYFNVNHITKNRGLDFPDFARHYQQASCLLGEPVRCCINCHLIKGYSERFFRCGFAFTAKPRVLAALNVGAIMINEEALLKAVLPVYHQTQKCRHDILCKELLQDESLKSYWEDEVSRAVTYIEELISDSVRIAIDEMYGGITKGEALSLISKKSLCKEEWFIAIIFENANYYGRR